MQYIHKTKGTRVEARRFMEHNKDRVFRWAHELQSNVEPTFDVAKRPILLIPTLRADDKCDMPAEDRCALGDYIVVLPVPKEWQRLEHYYCADFREQYQPDIEEDTPATAVHDEFYDRAPEALGISEPI